MNFFLPHLVLAEVFRGKFIAALREAFAEGKLHFHGRFEPLSQPSSPWQKCPFSVGLIRASEEGQPPDSQGRRAQGASEAIPTLS